LCFLYIYYCFYAFIVCVPYTAIYIIFNQWIVAVIVNIIAKRFLRVRFRSAVHRSRYSVRIFPSIAKNAKIEIVGVVVEISALFVVVPVKDAINNHFFRPFVFCFGAFIIARSFSLVKPFL
jgi:hypothetical protein